MMVCRAAGLPYKCAILMTSPLRTTPITTATAATNDVRQQAVPFWAVIFCILLVEAVAIFALVLIR